MFTRAAIYFEEIARRGSIRRASERLHIAPSAINRQILELEEEVGTPLFERMPQGLRLTAAGEVLVAAIRRWSRDFRRVRAQIDDLRGLRRGEVSIALSEGATEFFSTNLRTFQECYPGISYTVRMAGSQAVVEALLSGECELGLTFNPPESRALRMESTRVYQLGLVVPPGHELAGRSAVGMGEGSAYPLVIPDETVSLRAVLDQVWSTTVGGNVRYAATANGVGMIKSLVKAGVGVGTLTALDAFTEIGKGELVFIPLSDPKIPLSVLTVLRASERVLSVPASLLMQHLAGAMAGAMPGAMPGALDGSSTGAGRP